MRARECFLFFLFIVILLYDKAYYSFSVACFDEAYFRVFFLP